MTRMKKYDDLKRGKGIKDLYPNFSKDQLKEAEYNLNRYLEVCAQIFEENESIKQYVYMPVEFFSGKTKDKWCIIIL